MKRLLAYVAVGDPHIPQLRDSAYELAREFMEKEARRKGLVLREVRESSIEGRVIHYVGEVDVPLPDGESA